MVGLRSGFGKLCSVIRRLLFSAFQALTFLLSAVRGNARFGLRLVECDWPHSRRRRKFLIVGTINVDKKKIRVKIGDELYTLTECPQRAFFTDLDNGLPVVETSYFKLASKLYLDVDLDQWFRDKSRLWQEFSPETLDFTPVAVRTPRNLYIVEDGAHRLALSDLRGIEAYQVGISLWYFN